ncbi:hypothetical protein GCM10022381_30480 [Leifsonia kafniensis]|uniref:Htaa domain-containing protein n=1 Tax=Leifsonia kafniensis TaxID=475957 RepID=A0ABP7KSP2_9MICO
MAMNTTRAVETSETIRDDVGMAWRIKASFVKYIAGMNDGAVRILPGSSVTPNGEYYFTLEHYDFDSETLTGVVKFRGGVEFSGHFGMLNLSLTDPWISFREGTALISAVTGAGERVEFCAVAAAAPLIDGDVLMWRDIPTFLTSVGEPLFNNVYRGNEPFAPLTVRIPA